MVERAKRKDAELGTGPGQRSSDRADSAIATSGNNEFAARLDQFGGTLGAAPLPTNSRGVSVAAGRS